MKIKLNLALEVDDIEEKLSQALEEARVHKAELLEISYGTGTGEKKRRILNFLMKKESRQLYSRLVKSKEGWGRVFIYFRWE